MQLRTGKQKLDEFAKLDLVIDWDDLLHYRGKFKQQMALQLQIGAIFRAVGTGLVLFAILLVFFSAGWQNLTFLPASSLPELIFWIGVALLIYASFLLRDRDRFGFNLESSYLPALIRQLNESKRRPKDIEVDTYLSASILADIDNAYFSDNTRFLETLASQTLQSSQVRAVLARLGVNPGDFANAVQTAMLQMATNFDAHFMGLFPALFNKAVYLHQSHIDHLSVFFVLAESLWLDVFRNFAVNRDDLESVQLWLATENTKREYVRLWSNKALLKPKGTVNRAFTSRYSRTLETYGFDFTHMAATGAFALTMGREQEMQQIILELSRANGKAALLVGPPGVGKTHFLHHLAVKMVVEDVPPELVDKRLVLFDFNAAFTANQSLDEFKLVLQSLFAELISTKDVVVVFEEIEQLIKVREEYREEILSILENGIRNTGLQIVATTTPDNYNKYIQPNQAIVSLFQRIDYNEPSPNVALQVLIDEAASLERKYGVAAQVSALKQIVKLAPQFAYERVMPDKAIDLLSEAMMEAQHKGEQFVSSETIDSVVSRKVGMNVGSLSSEESTKLIQLEEVMHKRVVGQDAAIQAVVAALKRARAGFDKGSRPIAAFLFFGPTGVGKTEVARTLASSYYGSDKLFIRLDMSEYQEQDNLDRLIGRMDGDKFVGGYLTEFVRSRPFSLVLLDELEKANPKVLDLFLQVLDEGGLTDGAGRKVSFANTIIIATSNAGSKEIADLLSRGIPYKEVYRQVLPVLHGVYRVEFLNRFDRVIMFKPLNQLEVQQITIRMLDSIVNKMMEQGIELKITSSTVQDLAQLGYDPIYGARQLQRVIQENIEDRLAEMMIKGELKAGGSVTF